jgi:hypothetical protein
MGRHTLLLCCLALSVTACAAVSGIEHHRGPSRPETVPVFKVSAFKDVTAYVLTQVQQDLKGELKEIGSTL